MSIPAWRGGRVHLGRNFVPSVARRGEEKLSENPIPRKESRRVGEADPPMRRNRLGFPLIIFARLRDNPY
jgi:hypothetical protein